MPVGMNATPSANRVHIGIFGRRNAGKSSVMNAIAGQNLAIVSDVKGTTTDPVYKAMELLPLGPAMLIDTPGLDDTGELGELRVKKSYQALNKTDIAILVIDAKMGYSPVDETFIERLREKEIPFVIAVNKADLTDGHLPGKYKNEIAVSAKDRFDIDRLKAAVASLVPQNMAQIPIIRDLLNPGDAVVLVVPIDSAAPKGRLILPQQQTIRDILEAGALSVVCKETELEGTLAALAQKPKLVVTDSQVFGCVSRDTPEDIPLTSFSILFARHKGNLKQSVHGASAIESLKDGDKVLIAEGCTHHRQCDDIGTVKLPQWIREYSGCNPEFCFTSGTEFPDDLTPYHMVVHCGGCMLNEKEMKYRLRCAAEQSTPITNYGMLIAYINGILKRALKPFPEIIPLGGR